MTGTVKQPGDGRTVIDRDLLAQAKEILGLSTITATINEALRRVVSSQKAWRELIDHFANMDEDQLAAMAEARDRW